MYTKLKITLFKTQKSMSTYMPEKDIKEINIEIMETNIDCIDYVHIALE